MILHEFIDKVINENKDFLSNCSIPNHLLVRAHTIFNKLKGNIEILLVEDFDDSSDGYIIFFQRLYTSNNRTNRKSLYIYPDSYEYFHELLDGNFNGYGNPDDETITSQIYSFDQIEELTNLYNSNEE